MEAYIVMLMAITRFLVDRYEKITIETRVCVKYLVR